jgi:hypothetical protein
MGLPVGARSGSHEVLAHGEDGRAEVCRAQGHRIGRLVAIKIPPELIRDDYPTQHLTIDSSALDARSPERLHDGSFVIGR